MKVLQKESMFIWGILIFASILLFWNLGKNYLTNWDEAWYGDIARNMAETGNIITPYWNSKPFFDKPPLYLWLTAISFKIFGVSEFSERFISALSGVGVVYLVYSLGKLLFNSKTGILASLVLCSTLGFLYRARTGNLDVLLTFFLLLTMYCFYQGLQKKSSKWFLYMGIATGLGFLTKGFIAFLFPAMPFLYLVITQEKKIMISKKFMIGLGVALGIALAWVILSYLVNGNKFFSGFFSNQTQKITPELFFWKSFSLDYIFYLKSGLKFWFIPFVPAFIFSVYKLKSSNKILIPLYFFVILLMLSFSHNKSNWFIVPLYPITSLIIAYAVDQLLKIHKFIEASLIFLLVVVAFLQNLLFKDEYIVGDIAADEAEVALYAKQHTDSRDLIFLTNYYYPTTVFYSKRKIFAVYSDHEKNNAWWILPKSRWDKILKEKNIFVISNFGELDLLQKKYPNVVFKILYQSGDKLLAKSI